MKKNNKFTVGDMMMKWVWVKGMIVMWLIILLLLPQVLVGQDNIIRIMPLGNSITQGRGLENEASYRRHLWMELQKNGHTRIDFTGSMNKVYGSSSDYYKDYDTNHEGHWGWSANEILHGNTDAPGGSYNANFKSPGGYPGGKLSEWMNEYKPNIILLHLGTNDVFQSANNITNEDYKTRYRYVILDTLKSIISEIRKYNADATIFWASLIPAEKTSVNKERIKLLNELIGKEAPVQDTPFSRVFLVDQFSAFNALKGKDTYDNVHPNHAGAVKMAHKWYNEINEYLLGSKGDYIGMRFGVRYLGQDLLYQNRKFPLTIINAKNQTDSLLLQGEHPVKITFVDSDRIIINGKAIFSEGSSEIMISLPEGDHILQVEISGIPLAETTSVIKVNSTASLSSDASLKKIEVDGNPLPHFKPEVQHYPHELPHDINYHPKVDAHPTHHGAKTEVTQAKNIHGNKIERTAQIKVIAENFIDTLTYKVEFNIKKPHTFAVYFTSSNALGMIKAYADGESLISGDEVEQGKNISFEAIPPEGFLVNHWNINGITLEYSDTVLHYNHLDKTLNVWVAFNEIATNNENVHPQKQINIYLTNNILYWQNTTSSFTQAYIYNLMGQAVKSIDLNGERTGISLEDLVSGIYIINLTDGNNLYSTKIFIE